MTAIHCASTKLAIATFAGTALLLAAATMTTAAAAPLASGACEPTKKKFKVSGADQSTTSPSYVNVSETGISFNQGGSSPSCVIVSFSAEASAAANTVMTLRAVIDGVAGSCTPTDTFFVFAGTTAEGLAAHAMNFICPNVSPGGHVASIQFHRSGGTSVRLLLRTTIVNYQ